MTASETEENIDGRVLRAQRQREARRAQILEAARRVFADKGFHGASIQDLLDAAGIARGTFYAHFDSKEAAFAEVLGELIERIASGLSPVDVTSREAAYDQLLANITRALGILEDDEDLARLLFHQAGGVSEELRGHLERFFDAVAALVQRSLEAGRALGVVNPGDQALRARFIVGAMKEAATESFGGGRAPRPVGEVAKEMLDFALGGVMKDPAAATARLD